VIDSSLGRKARPIRGPLQSRAAAQRVGYVAPLAKLEGRESEIFVERDRKLEAARRQRQLRHQEAFPLSDQTGDSSMAALN